MSNVAFPFHLDARGRSATSGDERHVRELIEQVLFTSPGERVNRPQFGTGLAQLLFGVNSAEVASATEHLIQSALQQFLGAAIRVDRVDVSNEDSKLKILVRYVFLQTQQEVEEQFERLV